MSRSTFFFCTKEFFSATLAMGFIVPIISVLAGCGTETGNPVIKRPTTPRNIALDTVEAELIELSELGFESGSDSNLLSLSQLTKNSQATGLFELGSFSSESSQCETSTKGVTYTFEKSADKINEFRKTGRTVKTLIQRKQSITWESPLGAVTCSSSQSVQRKPRLMDGTSETRTGSFKKTISNSGNLTKAAYMTAEFNSNGERKTLFTKKDPDPQTVLTEKTITWNLNKSSRLKTSEGETSDESNSVVTSASPIKILIERERNIGLSIKSRVIKSGKTMTTRADASRIDIEFFDLSIGSGEDCYPTSGIIRGVITPSTSSGLQSEKFEIDFSNTNGELPELIFSDNEKIPLNGVCFD